MAYFPEYYGGEMWNRALSDFGANVGNALGQSLKYYRDRNDKLAEDDETIDDLHSKGVLDSKAWERIKAYHGNERLHHEEGFIRSLQLNDEVQKSAVELKYKSALARHA